jgi:antitoxin CcdA
VEVVLLEFDRGAPKRATNLSFNSDLLRRAKALGINLSARLEPELIRIVADEEQRQLAQELAPSVAAWAAYYETHSAVVDEWSEE